MTCAGVGTASFLIGLVASGRRALPLLDRHEATGTRRYDRHAAARRSGRPTRAARQAARSIPAALVASLRLPRSTRPKGYDLRLRLSPDEERFTDRVAAGQQQSC